MIGFISWEYDSLGLPEKGFIEIVTFTEKKRIRNFYRIDRFEGSDLRDGKSAKFVLCSTGSYWTSGFTVFYTDGKPEKTIIEDL